MDWLAAVDSYCERVSPALWAEPLNALSNAAFLLAAAVVWQRAWAVPLARALTVVLCLIGLGSFLFHTLANRLTGLLDVLPILGFILLYVFAASRDMLGWKPWQAGLAVLAFFPFAAVMVMVFRSITPWMESSVAYAPVPVLILVYAGALAAKAPRTAKGLAAGAVLLMVSLTFRTLDLPLCAAWPVGTHFLWHGLNAVMLAWMIAVLVRHSSVRPAASPSG